MNGYMHDDLAAIFHKGDSFFSYFLFAFLHTNQILKMDQLCKEKYCSLYPYRVDAFSESDKHF